MTFSNTGIKVFATEACKKVAKGYSFIGTTSEQAVSDMFVMNEEGTAFVPTQEATVNASNAYFNVSATLSPFPTTIPISNILLGDANGDGMVNVTDAVLVVNYLLDQECPVFFFENADINGDEEINVSDVVGIVNIILNE